MQEVRVKETLVRREIALATTVDTFKVLTLDDAFEPRADGAEDERTYARVRRALDIGSFGAYAVRADAGKELVHERTAAGPGADRHEELFVVLSGHATFIVDGQEVDVPSGTAVFVRDVEAKRAAVAHEDGTTILLVSGRRGQAWRPTPGEATEEFWPLYEAKDYEGALAVVREALSEYEGNPLMHYNIACMSSLLGRPDKALKHLGLALEGHSEYSENARGDEDFVALRDDPRFKELVS
jgi:mannose-6-phosphate isomerase-like protein (cupin superfamily)